MWSKYENYFLKHLLHLRHPKTAGLPYLRDKLFISILLITFPLGLLVYIPSVIISIVTGELIIVIGDTIAILLVGFILFYKNHSLLTKKILFSVNIYLLAFVLLLFLGTKGPGIILFISGSILATLYISKKAGLVSVAFIAVAYFFLILGFSIKSVELFFYKEFITTIWEYNASSWLVISLNLIAFNTILVLAVSFLVDQLQNSVLIEHNLQNQLKKESIDLLDAKLKSEESDRLKSAFLANMSHEIRTPMNGILGFSRLLKEPNLTGQEQQKYIGIIEKSGARMLNIISEIIDISKIESGTMEINMKELNINNQMTFILTFFNPEAECKSLDLVLTKTLPEKEAIITTDSEKIYAILVNLVKNAIKYTDNGSIEFGCDFIEIHNSTFLQYFVKDTGIGIAKDRQEAIFDRFIQSDIIDVQARQGAGLGLSIAKAYVEMLGGKIRVESEEGKGSTFYFTLPYHAKKQAERSAANVVFTEDNEVHIKNLSILIAEDDETSDMLITSILEKNNHKILHTINGTETIEACLNNPDIDLILMDIRMPEMNGYEATRQIREFNKDVVIIAQTAFGLSGDRQKAIDAGCNDYISKPIIKDLLMAMIQKHLKK